MKKQIAKFATAAFALAVLSLPFTACGKKGNDPQMEKQLKEFIQEYEKTAKPLYRDWQLAYFNASINSTPENWDKVAAYEMQVNSFLSDKARFARLKKIYDSKAVGDEMLSRQLKVIYNEFMAKQIDTNKLNEMTKMSSQIELKYSNFRAVVDGKKLSDNDVETVLKTSIDSKQLEKTWLAHKSIGPLVAQDIINLVKKRNEAARELGFKNYHDMSLRLSDQDPEEISKLFDELDNLTRDAFKNLKADMDSKLAARLKIKPEELMPWHYQNRYFQEAPQIYSLDLDQYYKGKDLVKLTSQYYAGLDVPCDDIIARSDLFEKPNKNQHAYCINIDRDAKDIRVLCNVKDDSKWAETMLHEFGHGIYEKYYDENLPWALKTPAHIFTTEAIAMMFGRMPSSPQWMLDMKVIDQNQMGAIGDVPSKILRLQQLVFSRWSQVMYRFEKSMYENPDQDLNKLWWDLVEKYQMIKRPAGRTSPDWATKIHIATSPCYYHNYHLGELFASQLYYAINKNVLKQDPAKSNSWVGRKEVGDFLKKNVFGVGARYYWNDMIEKATGEKLTAKYYAMQFVK